MLVLKFGGTSVGSVENMRRVKEIITSKEQKIVVLSAMSGTTNLLVDISNALKNNNIEKARIIIEFLNANYCTVINRLFTKVSFKKNAINYLTEVIKYLQDLTNSIYTGHVKNIILAQGELLSTYLFTNYLNEHHIKAHLIPALNFMRLDAHNEPDYFYIHQQLQYQITAQNEADIFITQGFITLDYNGNISNLKRGGSDYTATIIGACLNVEEVQIWTDIDGFHNNDPRYVQHTQPISQLSFEEAAELAYFGAKILHPQTVIPARDKNIPVRLKNTMQPEALGTLINSEIHGEGIKAIAAKDGITAIKIKSARMLLPTKQTMVLFVSTSIDAIFSNAVQISF